MFLPIAVKAEERTGSVHLKINEPDEGKSFVVYKVKDGSGSYTDPFAGYDFALAEDADSAEQLLQFIRKETDQEKDAFQKASRTYTGDCIDDLQRGLYLITQTEAPAGYEVIRPFIVSIPYTDENNSELYDIECSPKVSRLKAENIDLPVSQEEAKTGMAADSRIFYGTGMIMIGAAVFTLVLRHGKNTRT